MGRVGNSLGKQALPNLLAVLYTGSGCLKGNLALCIIKIRDAHILGHSIFTSKILICRYTSIYVQRPTYMLFIRTLCIMSKA